MTKTQKPNHYNQKPRRKAEFIKPPNILKAKVGSGGLTDDILNKAQTLLENNAVDFLPLAEIYLASLMQATELAQKALVEQKLQQQEPALNQTETAKREHLVTRMIYPAMQLKANGGMFHYPLITAIADRLIHFLEVVAYADEDVVDIVVAFHTTMRAILISRISGDGGTHGKEVLDALDSACTRYFQRRPGNSRNTEMQDLNQDY